MPDTQNTKTCLHQGQAVRVGNYRLYAGALPDITPESLKHADILIVLCESVPAEIWSTKFTGTHIWAHPIKDYCEPKGPWEKFLREVEKGLKAKRRIFVCCEGGHGRTGTFLASLISLIERPQDPISIVRERYCEKAVETAKQAETIFALAGKKTPMQYLETTKNPVEAIPSQYATAEE